MRGPIVVPSDDGQPVRTDRTASTSWRSRRGERPADPTRITSEAAEHFWPAWPKALRTTSPTARSKSADGVMTTAFLPDVSAMTRGPAGCAARHDRRSEEHTSELQSLMRISYAVFCLKKKKITSTK